MKIRNTTNNTIYVEDVDLYLPYDNGNIEEIDPDILKKSKGLRSFIISGTLEVAEYDPDERIEASIMFLKNQQAQRVVENKQPEETFISDLESNADDIEVRMHGIFYDAGGYGKVNRNLALKLHEAGIKIRIDPKKSQNQLKASELKPIVALTNTKISKNHISIDSVIPSFAEYSTGKYRILYTTVESYSIPKQFLECCQMYTEIWITSPWSASILKKQIDKPVYVIPAGVDSSLYTEEGPRFDFKPNIKSFVFLSVFGWGYRKGYDVLLKAYFEEFDANDDVSLLIASRYQSGTSRFHRDKIRDDINNIMRDFPNKDMPHVVRYSQVIPEQQMPQLYRAADCFVLPSRGEGSCNLPGTKIVTSTGLKDIETIVDGEHVLTHEGDFHSVLEAMCRSVDEEVYSIYTSMNGSSPITLTKEHPVFILPRSKVLKNGKKVLENFNTNNCEWIKASELVPSDYVVHSLNFADMNGLFKNEGLRALTTTNYLNSDSITTKDGMVYRNGRNSQSSDQSFIHPNCSPVPWRIELSEKFLRFLGLYIAEGWCGYNLDRNKGRISFSFHSSETEYHNIIIDVMQKTFNQKMNDEDYSTDGRKYRYTLSCNNTLCSEFFDTLCGTGSHNKHLPDFTWQLSKLQRIALLQGLFEGDGCFYNSLSSPSLSLSTVSEQLTDEVMLVLRSIGISGCKQTKKNRGFIVSVKGEQINDLGFKNSSYDSSKKKITFSVKNRDYVFLPVKKIEKHIYNGMVYNLEVDKDNSYTTSGFIVHNCLPPPEASLCGLPVIMTNVSGQQMYLREDNAFLIEMDHLSTVQTGMFHLHYWDGQIFPALTSKEVINQLKKAMRYVIEHPEEAQKRNHRLQKLIKEQFTWNNTANAAIRRLREIKKEITN